MNDCLFYLFTFLDDKDLFVCFYVNKLFNKITQHDLLWQKHCYWIKCDHDFYRHFKIGYILHRFLSKHITCQQPFNTLQRLYLSSTQRDLFLTSTIFSLLCLSQKSPFLLSVKL